MDEYPVAITAIATKDKVRKLIQLIHKRAPIQGTIDDLRGIREGTLHKELERHNNLKDGGIET